MLAFHPLTLFPFATAVWDVLCQVGMARQGPWCQGGQHCSKRLAEGLQLPGRLCCWLHTVGAKKPHP